MTDSRDRYRMREGDRTYRWPDILDPKLGMPCRIAGALLLSNWPGGFKFSGDTKAACMLGAALAVNALLEYQEDGPPDVVHPSTCMESWFNEWAVRCGSPRWAEHSVSARRLIRQAASLVWDALTPWTGRSPLWAPLVAEVEQSRARAALDLDLDNIDWDRLWTDEGEA